MNNKGFMMAEVIVVASIILVALVGLYVSYNKIFSIYNKRVDYYDVATLYELASIRDNILETDLIAFAPGDLVMNEEGKKVYFWIPSDADKIDGISETFKDYLRYLATSIESDAYEFLVMEKCANEDDCKYAYLEVYYETE